MEKDLGFLFSVWVKFFFLFTPFFALSMFLTSTRGYTEPQRRRLALQVSGAVIVVCIGLYFFGNLIFALFGITLNAFRVGAGALLFLSAVRLVQGNKSMPIAPDPHEDIAVVPLAVPVVVGPATVGTLLVMGAEISDLARRTLGCVALVLAVACLAVILLLGSFIERVLGAKGLDILSKITGLILAALAAQMILTGVHYFRP
ncbi:NAAT family transporter [bacterium]|nr:NAAT family transporter [bacterium]